MNMLILLLLAATPLYANEIPDELSDVELKKKLISSVKTVEVGQTLKNSAEFAKCREMYPFNAKGPDQAKLDKAMECFKQEIDKKKDPKALAELSKNLGLEQYGLVATKSRQELTEYLTNNLYQALTGVDRKEKDLKVLMEKMKFGNMKMVDQSVFIDLYTTQLVKNALFEVSRFCFENFRNVKNVHQDSSFIAHWEDQLDKLDSSPKADGYTDSGSKGFGYFSDITKKETIYQDMLSGLGANNPNNVATISKFFENCSAKIVPLCDEFQAAVKKSPNATAGRGANACLTKAKLQTSRKAIANANKIQEQFKGEDFMAKFVASLDAGSATPQFYDKTDEATSIDNLTNYSSAQILDGSTVDKKQQELQDKCSQDGSLPECEDFLVISDSHKIVEHTMDLELRVKKEAEMARVKALKSTAEKDLKEYLKENGYLDILAKYEKDPGLNVEAEIGLVYEAKRIAALDELKTKIGSRQMTAEEASQDPETKNANIKKNAEQSKEERARMAQVVLFNNIITGHLTLRKKGSNEVLGRNVNVLKKEMDGIQDAKIDENLFANLKVEDGEGSRTNNGEVFAGAEILDGILGAEPEDKSK